VILQMFPQRFYSAQNLFRFYLRKTQQRLWFTASDKLLFTQMMTTYAFRATFCTFTPSITRVLFKIPTSMHCEVDVT